MLLFCFNVISNGFFVFACVFFKCSLGTIGASLYLFEAVKLKIIDIKLRGLIRKDEKLYKFESDNIKKNEDSSSAID